MICSYPILTIGVQVNTAGGLFLEAPVSGSKGPAETGQLIFMCAGDREVYDDAEVQDALKCMGKADYYLGPVGKGTECKLVVNMIMGELSRTSFSGVTPSASHTLSAPHTGTMMASLGEGMTLAERVGLDNEKVIEILGLGACAAPMFALKGPLLMKEDYTPNFPLRHQQKDLRFAMDMGSDVNQALPVASAAHASYVRAMDDHGDDDFSAVIEANR
jgi:glyoxylate/succinic semialdehyde reductase